MGNDYKIQNDMKFENTVRKLFELFFDAWTRGNLEVAGRTLESLEMAFVSEMNDKTKEKMENLKFRTIQKQDIYNENDIQNMNRFSGLDDDRESEIDNIVKIKNRTEFKTNLKERMKIIVCLAKDAGLTFNEDIRLDDDDDQLNIPKNMGKTK